MSLVDEIKQLSDDTVSIDENFESLKIALEQYHRLIDEGKLIPRSNNLQSGYTVYEYRSNANMHL